MLKKFGLWAGGLLGILIFLYAALAALVNQGLSIVGAIVMLLIILLGGVGLILAVRNQ